MRHLRHAWPALAVVAVNPAMAFANHPSLRLTDAAIPRFEALSFFLLLLVVSSFVVWRVWNALRADFPHLLRRRAIAGVGEAHPAARGRWVMSPTARTNCLGFSLIFGMCILCCGGFMHFLFQVPAYLAFGWVPYLARVVPTLNPDPAMVATAVACLVGGVVGGHAFFRRLYANALPEPRRWPWRWTFRLVGLVVAMFVAGIGVGGSVRQTIWLACTPGPIIADPFLIRGASENNLKEIGVATLNHYDTLDRLPRSTFDAQGEPMHSWQTAILPYLDQDALHKQIDLSKPWTHPANAAAMQTRVKAYQNPSEFEDSVNGYPVSHYAGNVYVVMSDSPKRITQFPQGAANTILAGEVNTRVRVGRPPERPRPAPPHQRPPRRLRRTQPPAAVPHARRLGPHVRPEGTGRRARDDGEVTRLL